MIQIAVTNRDFMSTRPNSPAAGRGPAASGLPDFLDHPPSGTALTIASAIGASEQMFGAK